MKFSGTRIKTYLVITAFVLGFMYFQDHKSILYANIGNHYFKTGNQQRAVEYYDKSFSLGNRDPKLLNNYVTVIINTPLTVEAQERLAEIAFEPKDAKYIQDAKYFLYNLKREIHNKYPGNYIQQAAFNQKILHWGEMPITYTYKNTTHIPQEYINEIDNAFNEWERVSSGKIRFQYTKNSKPNIVVKFISKNTVDSELGEKHVIAYTIPNVSQNKLNGMEIFFNIYSPDGNLFSQNQIYNTALHEIFHSIGFMGHSYNENSIMYMSKNTNVLINDTRLEILDEDKTTLDLLYKIKPDITNANNLDYEYIPYLILGDRGEINFSKATEAKNYILNAPKLPGGYVDLAETLASDKKYEEAIENLKIALSLATNNDMKYIIYYNLSVSEFYSGNYYKSLEYIDNAAAIKDKEELHLLLAENYIKLKQNYKAENEYKNLIGVSPQNIDYSINLANLYIQRYAYMKARQVLKNYIKKYPQERQNPRLQPYKILMF